MIQYVKKNITPSVTYPPPVSGASPRSEHTRPLRVREWARLTPRAAVHRARARPRTPH